MRPDMGTARSTDIIIVGFNTREFLRACLYSIGATTSGMPGLRTIVVDNASQDGSAEMVRREFPQVQLITLEANIGFGPANNRGLAVGDSEYVLFLNSDAQLTDGALNTLVEFLAQHPRCAAVGPRLVYPDGRFQASCRRFPTVLRNFWNLSGMQARCTKHYRNLQNWLSEDEHRHGAEVDMVSGACFLARRAYLNEIGGFEENLFLYEEEADLFLPARKRGWDVRFCAEATVIHAGASSVNANELQDFSRFHLYRSKYYCFRKHYGPWAARLTHWSDLCIFSLSSVLGLVRGNPTRARDRLAACQRAYRESLRLGVRDS